MRLMLMVGFVVVVSVVSMAEYINAMWYVCGVVFYDFILCSLSPERRH